MIYAVKEVEERNRGEITGKGGQLGAKTVGKMSFVTTLILLDSMVAPSRTFRSGRLSFAQLIAMENL